MVMIVMWLNARSNITNTKCRKLVRIGGIRNEDLAKSVIVSSFMGQALSLV